VGPTTTVVTSTTVRSTTTSVAQARVTPVQSSSTTVAQTTTSTTTTTVRTTTTTRAIASLSVSLSHRTLTLMGRGTDVEIHISTDVSALPTRLCLSVTSDGLAWPWFIIDFSPDWPDLGGGCRGYRGGPSGWYGNYYTTPEIQEKNGVQQWTATVTVTDSLGRSATTTYSWNS